MTGVRMGEIVVSANPNDELVALGLGSCIGLAIVDRSAGVAGLAHIVLPESGDKVDQPGKFADTGVPELIAQLRRAGAVDRRFETAMVGGARMFELSGGLDIGSRNDRAVRAALAMARVPVRIAQTGGNQGRTVRIAVGRCVVTVRVAGQPAVTLLDGKGHSGGRPASGPMMARVSAASRLGGSAVSRLGGSAVSRLGGSVSAAMGGIGGRAAGFAVGGARP
jgi:chemotaxis protein CheD